VKGAAGVVDVLDAWLLLLDEQLATISAPTAIANQQREGLMRAHGTKGIAEVPRGTKAA
jgi:hypothetical protein